MSFEYSLQKVMDVKEQEKFQSQLYYKEAIGQFEQVATKLYHSLKRKESLEAKAREQITAGVTIFELQQHQSELLRLQQEINQLQRQTQQAREQMNIRQRDLVDKSVEAKKFEKMKQLGREEFEQEQHRLETNEMDELSVQLYGKQWN